MAEDIIPAKLEIMFKKFFSALKQRRNSICYSRPMYPKYKRLSGTFIK